MEKEELQAALEDAESTLEQEEAKVLRAQMELSTVRQEIDRRIHEKEEEFENTRRNHERALESMQASLEAETRTKAEALKQVNNPSAPLSSPDSFSSFFRSEKETRIGHQRSRSCLGSRQPHQC